METPNFSFLSRPGNSTLVTWTTERGHAHALIHDEAQARDLAAANLPGAISEAARAYLAKFHPVTA